MPARYLIEAVHGVHDETEHVDVSVVYGGEVNDVHCVDIKQRDAGDEKEYQQQQTERKRIEKVLPQMPLVEIHGLVLSMGQD